MSAASQGAELLPIVAIVIAVGVVSQVLSDRYQIPSVIFLITSGILLGPEALNILSPETLDGALSTIVGLSVAIIVFEGAFHLKINKLRESPTTTLRLITIGALVVFLGTSLAVYGFLGADIRMALLIGALLVATGPTVITPILDVISVHDRVSISLETEGVVNDVTAAILAIVLFESVIHPELGAVELLQSFIGRLAIGITVGIVVAGVIWYLLRHVNLSPNGAPQNARLIVLAGAIISFSSANAIAQESGIAAVAAAGVILGNANLPYEDEIEEFKGDITLLVLSFVFIALAALLEFEYLALLKSSECYMFDL